MLKKITLKGEQKKVLFLPPTNPIQIKGVAGSGKTTVALYRAKHLLETQNTLFQEAKIVIFTFNKTLAAYIRAVSPYINGGYQKDSDEIKPKTPDGLNVSIQNFDSWAFHFAGIPYDSERGWLRKNILPQIIATTKSNTSNILSKSFEFFDEEISWIKGKLFENKNEYIEASRTGRGTSDRVTKLDKEIIWEVYEKYNLELKRRGKYEFDDYPILALKKINESTNFNPPFTHIIIDEAQDLSKAQILTISKLVSSETNSISIIADAAQRIFKSGFTWREVGLNVMGGRTIAFKKNYRNTIQIAEAAKSLLDNEEDNEDFTEIEFSVRNGEKPIVGYFDDFDEQLSYLVDELQDLQNQDNIRSTIVLHRTNDGVRRIQNHLNSSGFQTELVKSNQPVNYNSDSIKICTMSSIKGLEFNNVFIMDLTDDVIPYPPGFNEADDEFHISTERRLLYTCMTRARTGLYLIGDKDNPSRYLAEIDDDLLNNISESSTHDDFEDDDLPF
jgi:superfamily I DNA/RNA helicase